MIGIYTMVLVPEIINDYKFSLREPLIIIIILICRLESERNKKNKKGGKSAVPITPSSSTPVDAAPIHIHVDKSHLANVRVIQRNLVYIIGLVSPLNTDEVCIVCVCVLY